MSLKIGDKFKLNPESVYASGYKNNPLDTLGEVTKVDRYSDHPINVKWTSVDNDYREQDLILQEEIKEVMNTNKIGELIVDWSELEVGDKAVFEGYTDDSDRGWRFTIGKEYTCAIDGSGDKGFIEDTDLYGQSRGCPVHDVHDYKFRLVYEVKPALPDFPDFPFKLRNGDKPEVRQWLKDNGVVWCDGDDVVEFIGTTSTNGSFLYINDKLEMKSTYEEDFNEHPYEEIQLEIQPAIITGYKLVEKPNKKSEKELQLEEIVAKLSSQLNKAQTELNKLK